MNKFLLKGDGKDIYWTNIFGFRSYGNTKGVSNYTIISNFQIWFRPCLQNAVVEVMCLQHSALSSVCIANQTLISCAISPLMLTVRRQPCFMTCYLKMSRKSPVCVVFCLAKEIHVTLTTNLHKENQHKLHMCKFGNQNAMCACYWKHLFFFFFLIVFIMKILNL